MIKKLFIVLLTAVLVLSAVSCSIMGNPTEKYLLSLQNTIKANSLESKSKIEVHLDLSKVKEDVRSELNKFKDITLNTDNAVDSKAKKQINKYFLNTENIVMDCKIFADGDNVFVKSDMLGEKYYKLQAEDMNKAGNTPADNSADIEEYKKLVDEMKKIWVESVKNEIISNEGTTVENTPDGDIKVSNLTLELTDEKVKNILQKLADIVSKSNVLLEQAKKGSEQYEPKDKDKDEIKKEIEKWFRDLPENMAKSKDRYTLDTIKLTAKVDRDSYIISQVLTGGITIRDDEIGELKISFNYEGTNWNINRKVNVDIPQIKKEDIGDFKDLDFQNQDFINKMKETFDSK